MEQSALLKNVGHLSLEPNPALLEHAKLRAESVQNRIAVRRLSRPRASHSIYVSQPGVVADLVERAASEVASPALA